MLYFIICLLVALLFFNSYLWWRLMPKAKKKGSAVLMDTCALMDGRINEVVRSGFVSAEILVPRFVIAELQLLADKADHLKRERARFGLQVIQDLQDSRHAEVRIISDDIPSETGVDEKLVKVALQRGAFLYTTDYNLLKVAEIEGVRVLNINALAQNLRPTQLPGEQTDIKIVQKGQERSQGVGYLEDGTLVVVENAGNLHGKVVRVEFTRNLQTTAGRMMFAKKVTTSKRAVSTKASKLSHQRKDTERPTRKPRKNQTNEDRLLEAISQQ